MVLCVLSRLLVVVYLAYPRNNDRAIVPDSGFNPKDIHPWGLVSTLIACAVDVAIYGGMAYLIPSHSSASQSFRVAYIPVFLQMP
jgi:hypothetical protein